MNAHNAHIELFVAARGWAHSSWVGNYYPDDLPDDWQLAFYSNEFRAIVVPASEWIEADPVKFERWVDDTHEDFLFYLEVEDPLTDWQNVKERTSCLGNQLGGFLLRPREADADLSIISGSLASATRLAPVSLILPGQLELSQTAKELLNEYKVECCWTVGEGEPGWASSQLDSVLAIARVVGNKTFTAREWREIIETCIQYGTIHHKTETRRLLLMIDSENPQMNDLRTATMIGDMLSMPMP